MLCSIAQWSSQDISFKLLITGCPHCWHSDWSSCCSVDWRTGEMADGSACMLAARCCSMGFWACVCCWVSCARSVGEKRRRRRRRRKRWGKENEKKEEEIIVRKDYWKVTKVGSKWSLTFWCPLAKCIVNLLKNRLKGLIEGWKNNCLEHSFIRWLNRLLQRCQQSREYGFRRWLKLREIWTRGGEERKWTKKKINDWHMCGRNHDMAVSYLIIQHLLDPLVKHR